MQLSRLSICSKTEQYSCQSDQEASQAWRSWCTDYTGARRAKGTAGCVFTTRNVALSLVDGTPASSSFKQAETVSLSEFVDILLIVGATLAVQRLDERGR